MASHHDVSYRLLSRQSTAPCLYSKRLENESIQFRICQEAQTHISRIGKNRAFHMLQLLCNILINPSGFQRQHLPQHQCSDQSRYRRHRCTLSVPKSAIFFYAADEKGGTQVFISYLMQIAIVLSAWGLWHITEHWARYFYFAYWRMTKKNAPQAWSLADAAQAKLKDSEVHNALLEALADFQKAQVFFMLAVQIACMIALHDLADIQSTSWQQFWNNIGIFFNLAVGGYLPVLLGLMILRQMGRKDSYSLIVSTCSVGLAIVTWLTTWELTIHRSEIQKVDIKSVGPPSCNGIAPTQYCWSFDWFWQNSVASSRGFGMIAFALVVQLCMTIDHLTVFKPAGASDDDRKRQNLFQITRDWLLHRQEWEYYENLVQHQRCLIWLAKMKLDTRHSLLTRSKWFVLLGTEMALISLSILLLKAYGRLLVNHGVLGYLVLDHKAWSLGQIIAVTIWVPVLVKFVWDTLKGGGNADAGKGGIASGPPTRSYTGSTVGGGGASPESGIPLA